MRFRERMAGNNPDLYYHANTCFTGTSSNTPKCPVADSSTQYTSSQFNIAMVDVETPNFKRLSAEGKLVFSPMWQENFYQSIEPTVIEAELDDTNNNIAWRRSFHKILVSEAGPLLTSTDTGALDGYLNQFNAEKEIAVTAAWANVDESEMLAYATIGEMPETIRWIADCYRRMIKVLALFRARKVKLALRRQLMNPVRSADALASFWMEMRYAIRPLAFEMEQLLAAIKMNGKPKRHTARGFHEVVVFDGSDDTVDLNHSKVFVTDDIVYSRRSTYRAGVLYDIGITNGNYLEVFGFDKPLESIYELTKLSFVLDWFLNVGDLLSSWTTSSNLTPLGSWVTEEHHTSEISTAKDYYQTYAGNYDFNVERLEYGVCRKTRQTWRRTIRPEKPVYPHIKINLNAAKLVDLAAIARQIYRGIMR